MPLSIVEMSLGLTRSYGNTRRNARISNFSVLEKLHTSIIKFKKDYHLHVTMPVPYEEAEFSIACQELFERIGPDLWPDTSEKPAWLAESEADGLEGRWRRRLVYARADDCAILRTLFEKLLYEKCRKYHKSWTKKNQAVRTANGHSASSADSWRMPDESDAGTSDSEEESVVSPPRRRSTLGRARSRSTTRRTAVPDGPNSTEERPEDHVRGLDEAQARRTTLAPTSRPSLSGHGPLLVQNATTATPAWSQNSRRGSVQPHSERKHFDTPHINRNTGLVTPAKSGKRSFAGDSDERDQTPGPARKVRRKETDEEELSSRLPEQGTISPSSGRVAPGRIEHHVFGPRYPDLYRPTPMRHYPRIASSPAALPVSQLRPQRSLQQIDSASAQFVFTANGASLARPPQFGSSATTPAVARPGTLGMGSSRGYIQSGVQQRINDATAPVPPRAMESTNPAPLPSSPGSLVKPNISATNATKTGLIPTCSQIQAHAASNNQTANSPAVSHPFTTTMRQIMPNTPVLEASTSSTAIFEPPIPLPGSEATNTTTAQPGERRSKAPALDSEDNPRYKQQQEQTSLPKVQQEQRRASMDLPPKKTFTWDLATNGFRTSISAHTAMSVGQLFEVIQAQIDLCGKGQVVALELHHNWRLAALENFFIGSENPTAWEKCVDKVTKIVGKLEVHARVVLKE